MLVRSWALNLEGRNYNLKKFVEMGEEEIAERISALDDLEEGVVLKEDDGLEDSVSLYSKHKLETLTKVQ